MLHLLFLVTLAISAVDTPSSPPLVSKAEILAAIPAKDFEGKDDPLELVSAVTSNEYFITLHSGAHDLMRVYAREDGGFRLLLSRKPEMDFFDPPIVFHYSGNAQSEGDYLHIADQAEGTGHFRQDYVYRLEQGRLEAVRWAEPSSAYRDLIREEKGEGVWKGAQIWLVDQGLTFREYIWNEHDGNCCPTAGRIDGTYRIELAPDASPEGQARYVIRMDSVKRSPIKRDP